MTPQEEAIAIKKAVETISGIGQYKTPDGTVLTAVSVEPDFLKPIGTIAIGLEVVITPFVEQVSKPYTGRSVLWKNTHHIVLRQWDERGTTIAVAKEIFWRLSNLDFDVTIGPRVMPHAAIGNIESRNIIVNKSVIERQRMG